jgi:hypothetical protein
VVKTSPRSWEGLGSNPSPAILLGFSQVMSPGTRCVITCLRQTGLVMCPAACDTQSTDLSLESAMDLRPQWTCIPAKQCLVSHDR